MEDVIKEISGHYSGINIERLKRRIASAARVGAGSRGFAPLFSNSCLFTIDPKTKVNQWGIILETPEYLEAVASIYSEIEGIVQYLPNDIERLKADWGKYKSIPEAKELARNLKWLQARCKDYDDLVKDTKYDIQTPIPATPKELPEELQTHKRAFDLAVERGLMAKDGNRYKWLKKPTLLAYFIGRLWGDEVETNKKGKKIWIIKEYIEHIKEIEEYFEMANVGQARNNKKMECNPTIPRGGEEIDDIIKAL